jgi:chromate transporter
MVAGMRLLKWLFAPSLLSLTWVFFKIGLVFFGGGFVVIPVMHHELVTNLHWLTNRQFIDGTAISQLTPGPVAVLATFAGYQVAGVAGALVGTAAIFLPGSVLMVLLSRSYEYVRNHEGARHILDTLIPVIVGLLISAALQIGRTTMTGWTDFAIFAVALTLLVRYKLNPALLIIAAALLGLLRAA